MKQNWRVAGRTGTHHFHSRRKKFIKAAMQQSPEQDIWHFPDRPVGAETWRRDVNASPRRFTSLWYAGQEFPLAEKFPFFRGLPVDHRPDPCDCGAAGPWPVELNFCPDCGSRLLSLNSAPPAVRLLFQVRQPRRSRRVRPMRRPHRIAPGRVDWRRRKSATWPRCKAARTLRNSSAPLARQRLTVSMAQSLSHRSSRSSTPHSGRFL